MDDSLLSFVLPFSLSSYYRRRTEPPSRRVLTPIGGRLCVIKLADSEDVRESEAQRKRSEDEVRLCTHEDSEERPKTEDSND